MKQLILLFLFFLTTTAYSQETSLTQHTSQIESSKWNLYFTPLADRDFKDYQQVHAQFKSQMEIICVALVNQQDEIIRIVSPPASMVFPLSIQIEPFLELNKDNQTLIDFWNEKAFTREQKEMFVLSFIQNALMSPLGEIELISQGTNLFIKAAIEQESLIFPLSFCLQQTKNLFTEETLDSFFNSVDWKEWDSETFLDNLSLELTEGESLPLKKTWFHLSTETSSRLTQDFNRQLSFIRAREKDIAYVFIIHSHPYPQQWKRLARFPNKLPEWAATFDFVLLPSSIDIVGNLEGIIPFAGIYSFDPGSKERRIAYYAVDSELLDLSNEMNLSLATLQKRELTPEENAKGMLAVKNMVAKRAKVTRLSNPKEPSNLNERRLKRELIYLLKKNEKVTRDLPLWNTEWTLLMSGQKNLKRLQSISETWDTFCSLHPFPKEITSVLFTISNHLKIRVLELQLKEKGKAYPLKINEVVLEDLEKITKNKTGYTSQKELLQKLQQALIRFL